MAELMGKETGVCKGVGDSMHSTAPENGVIFSTAIVGGNIPIAMRVALGIKLKKDAIKQLKEKLEKMDVPEEEFERIEKEDAIAKILLAFYKRVFIYKEKIYLF